ncbi:phosphate ABC transporter permease subunit PstC [Sulfurihydrogenibium subterraneum]|uniref:phosphate ABC transporter permease subunit PstC n=1 Tax=Sulfurihydrogenibium subterraneum TaxID=171121 RepID=UPI000490DEFE|nr:phosphate ABC transporter permease subunit PstC [Sulfurihydrogenibium subterraneum]
MNSVNSALKKAKFLEYIFRVVLGFAALFIGIILPIVIFIILYKEASLAIDKLGIINFITSTDWDPVAGKFGGLVPLVGTLIATFLATLIAAPISMGIAIFLTELSPNKLKPIFSTAIELLAAIPSIIYGMWGLFVVAPLFGEKVEPWLQDKLGSVPVIGKLFEGSPTGVDVLTTSLVLAIMIIPFMSSVVKDAFNMVPPIMKESAYALGATKWEVIKQVMIPITASGIAGGLILSIGRALGETMAVTFLAGNVNQIPHSLLDPFTTITVALANQFTEADTDIYLSSLYFLALILFIMSFIILYLSKLMLLQIEKKWKV